MNTIPDLHDVHAEVWWASLGPPTSAGHRRGQPWPVSVPGGRGVGNPAEAGAD
jgi:hypothetical protein